VFLGNIHPGLQAEVLRQIETPRFVALDTMNLWIETAREALLEVLRSLDLLIINDSEARELADEANLLRAGRKLLALGPRTIVIKKGEHGALMLNDGDLFVSPAVPLEDVKDPTGAGDAFAGGLLGHLAAQGDVRDRRLREAIGYGTVLASFAVQNFGVQGLYDATPKDIERRFHELRLLTQFGQADPVVESRSR
jgi:sugar/nucleoside kinase (ribokinase family)